MRRIRSAITALVAALGVTACDATVYTTVKRGEGKAIKQLSQTFMGDPFWTRDGDGLVLENLVMAVHPISRELYFADPDHSRLLRLDASGVLGDWAGHDAASSPPTPQDTGWQDMVADAHGNLFVAQKDGTIVQVAADGGVSRVAALPNPNGANWEATVYQRGLAGLALDSQGYLYVASAAQHAIWRIRRGAADPTPDRLPIANGHIVVPQDVAVGSDGALYVADAPGGKGRIARVAPDGSVRPVALVVGSPSRLVVDAADTVYYIAPGYSEVRKVLPTGEIQMFHDLAADAPGENAPIPVALSLTGDGHLLVVDSRGQLHRLSLATGRAEAAQAVVAPAIAERADFRLSGVASANGTTWVTEEGGALYGVKDGAVRVIRGADAVAPSLPRERARFGHPRGLVFRPDGTMIVSDTNHGVLKTITPGGLASVFAGDGKFGHADGPATQASFTAPEALAIAPDGTLYVADAGRIRQVAPDGHVTTWPGSTGEAMDGVQDLAVGKDGRVYALAQSTLMAFSSTGQPFAVPGAEKLESLSAVAVDPQGRLLVLENRLGDDNRGTTLTMLLPDGRGEVLVATRADDRDGQVLGEYKVQFWGKSWPAEPLSPGDLTVGQDGTAYFIHHNGVYGLRNYGN